MIKMMPMTHRPIGPRSRLLMISRLNGAKAISPNKTASRNSDLAKLGDLAVIASALTPKTSLATLAMKALSTPPEYAIITEVMSRKLSFKALNFKVVAAGDSYNDVGMLQAANRGYFFDAPEKVTIDYPEIPTIVGYNELITALDKFLDEMKAQNDALAS